MLFCTGLESFFVQVYRLSDPSWARDLDRTSRFVFPVAFFAVSFCLVGMALLRSMRALDAQD